MKPTPCHPATAAIVRHGWSTLAVLFLLTLAIPLSGHAALILGTGANSGMVYDDDRNLTFTQDANLAATQTFGVSGIDSNGFMTWSTANAWIAAMNAASYLGHNTWRLPHSSDNAGYNHNSSLDEMSHLYYSELGGSAAATLGNHGPFLNLPNDVWSDHTASWNSGTAFYFSFGRGVTPGYQTADWKETSQSFGRYYSAWAVFDGNGTPEPSRTLLLALGLAALLGRRHRALSQRPGAVLSS